jgi:AraC-like DNA-binding protein
MGLVKNDEISGWAINKSPAFEDTRTLCVIIDRPNHLKFFSIPSMHYHFSFYSSVLLIFVSQGLVFAGLLLHKGITAGRNDCKWLSLFVVLCSLYILPYMLGFAGWYSLQPYRDILFYLPLQQTLLIGPAIFFYTQSLLNPTFVFTKKNWLHLLPAVLYLLYSLIVFITDKVLLNEYYFYANGRDKDFDAWYQITGLVSMILYAVLSLRYYLLYKKFIFQYISFADYTQIKWIRNCLFIFIAMLIFQLVFFVLFPNWGSFLQKWWYYLLFAFLHYYIGLAGYINNIKGTLPFYTYRLPHAPVVQLPYVAPLPLALEPHLQSAILLQNDETTVENDETVAQWKIRLETLVAAEELYKNPKLTLLDIAQLLQTNPTHISKMVNKGFHMNFNDWINAFRVKAVIAMLENYEYEKQTLLGISMDCGFNSKSSFNRCFKKATGLTPQDFIKNLVPNHDLERQDL